MNYVKKNLIRGETVVYKTRLHWSVLLRPILFGQLSLLLPLVSLAAGSRVGQGVRGRFALNTQLAFGYRPAKN